MSIIILKAKVLHYSAEKQHKCRNSRMTRIIPKNIINKMKYPVKFLLFFAKEQKRKREANNKSFIYCRNVRCYKCLCAFYVELWQHWCDKDSKCICIEELFCHSDVVFVCNDVMCRANEYLYWWCMAWLGLAWLVHQAETSSSMKCKENDNR